MKHIMNFLKEEDGATAVEYGIMVALIAAVIIAAVYGIGQQLNTTFTDVSTAMANPGP